jgi:hypothetical protein
MRIRITTSRLSGWTRTKPFNVLKRNTTTRKVLPGSC